MIDIPEQYQRITESQIEAIVKERLSTVSPISSWMFRKAFPNAKLVSIDSADLHVDRDHRRASEDDLAYGESDIEVVATVCTLDQKLIRVGLLVEMKVDARQMEQQGLRYRARATHRRSVKSWEQFQCVLVAPNRYLESAYPLGGYNDAGWDHLVALEEIAKILNGTAGGSADSKTLIQATDPANTWNKPIPSAAQFWEDLSKFQRKSHPDVPTFINRQKGAGISVWPSFYENQLANNSREIRRKRVQIVLSGKLHVALFIKNVLYDDFAPVAQSLIENDINVGKQGTAWQSFNIRVPFVDPLLSLESQTEKLDMVFDAARRLYKFFITHEAELLRIPQRK